MSGGALNYVYTKVYNAIDSGYGLGDEQEELVRDVGDLLHSIEWSASGDYAPDEWRSDLAEFCSKWSGGYKTEKEHNEEGDYE